MEKESGFNKMAAENGVSTELGFIEKVDSHKLEAVYFPSKVGGKPAWLCQRNLPTLEELKCDSCSKIMKFLLQVYAPLDEDENCFHRMLYLFICPNEKCYSKNKDLCFKVFRSQLPRENDYFANEPISTEIEAERVFFMMENIREKSGTLLCYVCGYPAEKKCARCKVIAYCSKEHQVYDWKDGHKNDCEILKQRKGTTLDYYYKILGGIYLIVIVISGTKGPICVAEFFKNSKPFDMNCRKFWASLHFKCTLAQNFLPRVHFMHLGPKIFGVDLTFCWRSGVIFFL